MLSKVYFSSSRAKREEESLVHKIRRVFKEAGLDAAIGKGDIVAVKIHIGERYGHTYVRPKHVRTVVELVRELGGSPFVTDTTGLDLTSSRGDALKCIEVAALNGFTRETVGAPIIVADGLKGLEGVKVKIDGLVLKEISLPSVLAEADALISLAHVKGHPRTGLGGAIKNIAVGCVNKTTKALIHLKSPPYVKGDKCNGCALCVKFCPVGAIEVKNGKAYIDSDKCLLGCGCWSICPENAISSFRERHRAQVEFGLAVADAAYGVVKHFTPKVGFINLAYDITPHCDCFTYSDIPMVPDIGVLASKDPVAIDKASIDLIREAPGIPSSAAEELKITSIGVDKLAQINLWEPLNFARKDGEPVPYVVLEASSKLGLGSLQYELIHIV
ncbi:MAG: DUF362 domain-containing protein [Candidatus Bathyarchaeia archaeon]